MGKEPATGDTGHRGEEARPKDKKSRMGGLDWGRVIGSAMTAGAVLYVAYVGNKLNKTMNQAQLSANELALYANRETAVNALRGQVFNSLAQHVVTKLKNEDYRKVALLAAFHGNLSKFIDTRPVFAAFLKEIQSKDARHELRRLAKRVARRQADYIVAHGGTRRSVVLDWRPPTKQAAPAGLERFSLDGHKLTLMIEGVNFKAASGEDRPVEDVENTVDVEVTFDKRKKRFSVSYLDVPYMDNIFVVHEKEVHRIALLLVDMNRTDDGGFRIEFEALHFPASIILPVDVPSARDIQSAQQGTRHNH